MFAPTCGLHSLCLIEFPLQTVKEKVVGSPETTTEKAQRVAKETVGSASQTVKDATTKAHSQASDIAQDAQDAYNRQHGDSAYQKACSALLGALHAGTSGWPCCPQEGSVSQLLHLCQAF